ncbi:MAG: hypothetical protein ACJ8GO_12280, partial [Ramlibacter sp.]
EVWDSPNSAGVVIDAIRCARIALDRGIGGALNGPSGYFMKSPPLQYTDDEAHELVEAFIRGDADPALPAAQAADAGPGALETSSTGATTANAGLDCGSNPQ